MTDFRKEKKDEDEMLDFIVEETKDDDEMEDVIIKKIENKIIC